MGQGVTCAKMNIPSCSPELGQRYQILAGSEGNGDVLYDCETLNAGDECAEATCYLEANFVSGFIREAFNGNSPNLNEYSHALGYIIRFLKVTVEMEIMVDLQKFVVEVFKRIL